MRLGVLENLITARCIPCNKCTLTLSAQVLNVLGVAFSQTLQTAVQVLASSSSVVDQVQTLNLLNDSTEQDSTCWVAHPSVELAVGLVRLQGVVSVVVSRGLRLLREGHHIGGSGKVPVVVGPELAGCADTGLDLVDDKEHVVAFCDVAEALEESRGSVVVTTLGLNGLDDDGGDGLGELLDQALRLLEAALLLGGVLRRKLVERVLEGREGGLGPVEGGDVELVDGLGAGGGQTAEEAAVEALLEGHDGHVGGTRGLVDHGRIDVGLGELGIVASTLLLALPHEGGLVCELVGVGAGLGSEDLVETLGGDGQNASLEDVGPVVLGEVAERRAVDDGRGHFGGSGCELQAGVVVAHGDRGNLGVDVEEDVAVKVGNTTMPLAVLCCVHVHVHVHVNGCSY